MSFLKWMGKCVGVLSKYASGAYFGYKAGKTVEGMIQKKRSQKSQPRPSHLSNPNSRWKKFNDNEWVKKFLEPGFIGAILGIFSVLFYQTLVFPLMQAERAKNYFDECFDEKLLEKYMVKPLNLRIKEDDWPTNLAKLPKEMDLEEKAQMCGLFHEDLSTLDPTASQIHFILSSILFLSELDKEKYESLLAILLRLLRAGKLSPRLRNYILMLLLRRGYKIPKYLYLLLKPKP